MLLAVLVATTIGVLPSIIASARWTTTSAMASRAAAISTARAMCVLFGLFNYLCNHSGGLVSGGLGALSEMKE